MHICPLYESVGRPGDSKRVREREGGGAEILASSCLCVLCYSSFSFFILAGLKEKSYIAQWSNTWC